MRDKIVILIQQRKPKKRAMRPFLIKENKFVLKPMANIAMVIKNFESVFGKVGR